MCDVIRVLYESVTCEASSEFESECCPTTLYVIYNLGNVFKSVMRWEHI